MLILTTLNKLIWFNHLKWHLEYLTDKFFFCLQMVYNFPDESSFIVSTIQGKTFSKNTNNLWWKDFIKTPQCFSCSPILLTSSVTFVLPQMTPVMDFTLSWSRAAASNVKQSVMTSQGSILPFLSIEHVPSILLSLPFLISLSFFTSHMSERERDSRG